MSPAKAWETYEQVATYLLEQIRSEFGLDSVEGKQKVPGAARSPEIDGKGVCSGGEGFIIIECKRWGRRLDPHELEGLAYRIQNTGAKGGIVVTPIGLSEGAAKVAEYEGIRTVILSAESTRHDYLLSFLNRVFMGVAPGEYEVTGWPARLTYRKLDGSEEFS